MDSNNTALVISSEASAASVVHQVQGRTVEVAHNFYLSALEDYHVGDHIGMLGLVVSVVGLFLTYREAKRSRTAAEAARDAAEGARRGRKLVDVSLDLVVIADNLSILKRTVQSDDWTSVSSQIDVLCRELEVSRQVMRDGEESDFTEDECGLVKGSAVKLRELEIKLTKKSAKPPSESRSINALQKEVITPLTQIIDNINGLQHRAKLISARR